MTLYSEQHNIFRKSIKRFLDRKVKPHLDSWEKNCDFPSEVFREFGSEGFLGILIPEDWGGVGGDYLLASAWCEEFGRLPAVGFTTAVNMHSLVISPALSRFGSQEAKEKWLGPAVTGEAIGAYAFTEPGAGSDLSQIRTKAVRKGKGYILNGAKTFITNGARADFILVLAKTDEKKGYQGFTTFVVDSKSPGFSVTRRLSKLGWHCSDTAELSFTDVALEPWTVLGEVGQGWPQAMSSLEWERLMLSLGALAGAEACLEETVSYVNDRKVFGRSVGSFEVNKRALAEAWSELQSARAICHLSLNKLSKGERCRKEVSLAKLFVCELAIEVADLCLQLHGGYGYTTEFSPERWLRDLRLNTIGGGTSQIMTRVAAGELFGRKSIEQKARS